MKKILLKNIKVAVCFFVLILLFSLSYINTYALEFSGIKVMKEINVPEGLNLTVRDILTTHDRFLQATAREDGYFAIYNQEFDKNYVDIYDDQGLFLKEIYFTSPHKQAIELTEETLNIYFYSSVLVYNLETEEVHNYAIPDGAAVNGEVYEKLNKSEFVSGDWKYTCNKTLWGECINLIRTSGDDFEILINFDTPKNIFWSAFIPGIAIAMIGVLFREWLRKKRKTNKTG